jgi:hypothetical protein
MSGFDFFVDLTVTGTALGLDHTSAPEAVQEVFGGGGLVKFSWHRHTLIYFSAQAHRLPLLVRDNGIEPALVESYGAFPDRIDLDELLKAVAAQGFPLEEWPHHNEDLVDYWSPVTHMIVLAERGSRDVLKVLGPEPRLSWRRFPDQLVSLLDRFEAYARHIRTLTDGEREAWFAEHAEPNADWWDCLLASVEYRWTRLRLAVHRAATERGVYPPDQAAATEVGLLVDADLEPDATVRRWLATAVLPEPSDIAAARRLRDQIHEVSRALPRLTDSEVAARLREWVAVRPRLLAG